MGDQTFRTAHALDGKPDQDRVKPDRTFIMAITDKTALFSTGALGLKELQTIHHAVILLLGKIIVFFKDNCYHDIGNSTKEHGSQCCKEKDRSTLEGWDLSFSIELVMFFSWNVFFYATKE